MPTSVIKMEIPYARVMVSDCVTRYSYAPRLHFSGKKEYPFLNTVSLSVKEDITRSSTGRTQKQHTRQRMALATIADTGKRFFFITHSS